VNTAETSISPPGIELADTQTRSSIEKTALFGSNTETMGEPESQMVFDDWMLTLHKPQ
jgi:hypothetical protein